jgi:hypothetical protein
MRGGASGVQAGCGRLPDGRRRALYDSSMRSTTDECLGRICQAIDELAGTSKEAAPAARLAAIWEMVADANPELARRLPGYLSAAE